MAFFVIKDFSVMRADEGAYVLITSPLSRKIILHGHAMCHIPCMFLCVMVCGWVGVRVCVG